MTPAVAISQAPVPPPSYHRTLGNALQLDALTLVTRLHLLAFCQLAVGLASRRGPSPLSAGPGGAPRTSSDASLLLRRKQPSC